MNPDRRRQKRLPAQGTESHLRVQEDILALGLEVVDLSASGAFIRTQRPLETGTRVELELVRRGIERTVRVTGRVVSANAVAHGGGMAVAFEPLQEDAAERLKALVSLLERELAGEPAGDGSAMALMGRVSTLLGDLDETMRTIAETDAAIAQAQQEIKSLRAAIRRVNVELGGGEG